MPNGGCNGQSKVPRDVIFGANVENIESGLLCKTAIKCVILSKTVFELFISPAQLRFCSLT